MFFRHKFFKLADYWLIFKIIIVLSLVRLGLRVFGFKRVFVALNWLALHLAQTPVEPEQTTYINQITQWIQYVKRHGLYRGNCLSRSLVLWWLLRRRGIETVIRIGTRQQMGQFQAHAWVEYQGQPLNAGPHVRQRYTTFDHAFVPDSV
jgi:hypothetical protein